MTTPISVPADAIIALIEERDRYESWLGALDARRGATPAHVFERVRADYDGRLRGVHDKLGEHVQPLRDAEAALVRRQDEVAQRLGARQDELAELELRTLVGEFAADDGERRVQQAANDVRELDGERRSVGDQLTELRALLERATKSGAPAPAASEGPTAPTASVPLETEPAVAEPQPEPAWTPDPAAETAAASPAPANLLVEEDAFVGTGPKLDALAASLGGAVAPPPSPTGSTQERTLRCPECGAMNYPTEWYCEKCGGELAAL